MLNKVVGPPSFYSRSDETNETLEELAKRLQSGLLEWQYYLGNLVNWLGLLNKKSSAEILTNKDKFVKKYFEVSWLCQNFPAEKAPLLHQLAEKFELLLAKAGINELIIPG